MATKGNSGSRRWITRRPIDARPIVGMYDEQLPAWVRILEAIAPWGCITVAILVASIVAYAFGIDLISGHL